MLSYLIRKSRNLMIAAALVSITSGLCSVLLLSQVNAALTATSWAERAAVAWRFAIFALAAMFGQMISSVLFERLNQRAHADLRRFISKRVISADFRRLEEVGSARVQAALSEHCTKVAEFFVSFPRILVNAIIVLGSLVYVAWLSWQAFLGAVIVIGLGSLGYHLAHLRAIRHLEVASKEQGRLFDHFRSLTDGAKELRLHAKKRRKFTDDVLDKSIDKVRRERTFGMSLFLVSSAWGNFLIYAFIGLVLFVLVGDVPDRAQIVTGFALVFIYMVAPLESLLVSLPNANLAKVAGLQIDEIVQQLVQDEVGGVDAVVSGFDSLVLCGVEYQYYHESADDLFTLGPIDLSFSPGEITYLVGGNGSGKTSLAKMIVGLYRPELGEIRINGEQVFDANRDRYRQMFSAIFSDFHLFEQMMDTSSAELDQKANMLLEKLHLNHKVHVHNGAFSTRSLSQGQRKRLALVVAYLEDRPFIVFDEWAADQDPVFKEVFYRELLVELKAQGKTVLVITHDDRYFHLADRLIRMENGQMLSVEASVGALSRRSVCTDPSSVS